MSGAESLAPVSAVSALAPEDLVVPDTAAVAPSAPGASFENLVTRGLNQVNESLLSAEVDMQKLATGDVDNLHQMMIRLEESRLSFQLMLQVRNRLLESYQEVMRMQV